MPDNENPNQITMDVTGGGNEEVTMDVTPGEESGITMNTEGTGGGSDGPYARKAEAWAVGKRNGVDVPSTDETYHNNSKYWAENASFLRAQLAVMVGNLEGLDQEWSEEKDALVEDLEDSVDGFQGQMDALQETMIAAGLRKIPAANLLKQNYATTRNYPSSAVIAETLSIPAETAAEAAETLTFTVSNEAITSSYVLHGIKAANSTIVSWTSVSATFAAGAATITITARNGSAAHSATTVTVYLCTVASTDVPYGDASRIGGTSYPYMKSINSGNYPGDDSVDGILCTVVSLTGTNIVEDIDGVTYNTAIRYAITANSAYLNTEWLMYFRGQDNYYTPGGTCKDYGQIPEMTAGKRYTVSCWVRVVSGDGAIVKFAYGGNYYSSAPVGNDTTNYRYGISDPITIEPKNGAWQRVWWTFDYNPTGTWYTEESATLSGTTYTKRTYNYQKRVLFGMCRKHTAVVQMCGFRLHEGEMYEADLGKLLEDYQSLHTRQTNLEAVQLELFGAAGESF